MSVEENKVLILRAIENWNCPGSRDVYFDLYDDNVVIHGFPPGLEGLAELRHFYSSLWAAFPDGKVTIEDCVAEGDRAAVRGIFGATHQGDFNGTAATGRHVSMEFITILSFSNGKCIERWNQADLLGLMQQLGAMSGQEAD